VTLSCSRRVNKLLVINHRILTANEQIEVRECLLLFGAESFVFQFAIQKFKDQDI